MLSVGYRQRLTLRIDPQTEQSQTLRNLLLWNPEFCVAEETIYTTAKLYKKL